MKNSGNKLNIRVTPKASVNKLKIEELLNGEKLIRVYVTAPAEDGKANQATIELLAKHLGIAKSKLSIVRGLTTRDKVVQIDY